MLPRDVAVIDFETLPIEGHHPPQPTGVAIRVNGKSRYYAFGHLGGNNSGYEMARQALGALCDSGMPLLFHNAKFDLGVMRAHFGLAPLPRLVHDTLPMLFLKDPRAETFSLKPSAERILNLPPAERDAIEDWLMEHQPFPFKLTKGKNAEHYVGAYVGTAPVELVAPYACGDVDRTYDLFQVLHEEISARGMWAAYLREQRLLPHIMEMEQQGIRIDTARLGFDIAAGEAALLRIDQWIAKQCKCAAFNVDSGPELTRALVGGGYATEERLGMTPTGQTRTSKDALAEAIDDPQMLAVLRYRGQMATSLRTFMKPWHAVASDNDGFICTYWNATRSDRGGARTGRLSSTPNFQNIPQPFAFDSKLAPFPFPPLPLVRSYIVPYAEGDCIIDRDYSQQEPRILAHYEGEALQQAYLRDPWIDFHDHAKAELAKSGRDYPRKIVKKLNLGIIYGEGVGLLAENTGLSVEETRSLKDAILRIYPGLKGMYRDMKERAKAHEPIRTWGGREYYCEPPKVINGQLRHFDYKLVNVLIQGSAADCTKEATIRFCEAKRPHWRVLMTVHDELVVSVPRAERDAAMELLRESMESVELDVPMKSEGTWSPDNWASLKEYDKKGKRVS